MDLKYTSQSRNPTHLVRSVNKIPATIPVRLTINHRLLIAHDFVTGMALTGTHL